jgi:hypothetical protein
MSSEPLILGSAHRLKGENLHVLIDDIDGHLSNASAGLAKFKVDIILYDAILNDKVGISQICMAQRRLKYTWFKIAPFPTAGHKQPQSSKSRHRRISAAS